MADSAMHWQANLRNGEILTGEATDFATLNPLEVALFQIVERHPLFCLSVWHSSTMPIVYGTRETPNEVVHVIGLPDSKVFIFEGTGDVISLTEWGDGVFGPI